MSIRNTISTNAKDNGKSTICWGRSFLLRGTLQNCPKASNELGKDISFDECLKEV